MWCHILSLLLFCRSISTNHTSNCTYVNYTARSCLPSLWWTSFVFLRTFIILRKVFISFVMPHLLFAFLFFHQHGKNDFHWKNFCEILNCGIVLKFFWKTRVSLKHKKINTLHEDVRTFTIILCSTFSGRRKSLQKSFRKNPKQIGCQIHFFPQVMCGKQHIIRFL
jgi:hypothetical protein